MANGELRVGVIGAGRWANMLATLSVLFTHQTDNSSVIPPASQQQIADALQDDAELMSNTQLEQVLADEPEDVQQEVIDINTDVRPRALQVALLVPILAALVGLFNAFRMVRIPEPEPSSSLEGM